MKPRPHNIAALYQLALSQQGRGQLDKAIKTYRQVLQLKPDFIEAMCNLGGALHASGQYHKAADCYNKVLAVNPRLPQLHYNLGAALQAMGQAQAALASYARAVDLKPDYLEAHFNSGMVDIEQTRFQSALEHFRQAVAINPGIADVHNSLGLCLKHLGRTREALIHFHQALQIQPDHFEALNNLALELMADQRLDDAIHYAERALALQPAEPKLLYNLGIALKARKRYDEAAGCFRKVLRHAPNALHANLALAHTLQTVCDWRDPKFSLEATAAVVERSLGDSEIGDIDLFNALSLPLSGETLLRVAQRQTEKILLGLSHLQQEPFDFSRTRPERLRIGYLSPKYLNHPGAHLMGGLFNVHDRARFEVFAYSLGPDDGSLYRSRIEREAEHFVDLRDVSLLDCVTRIRTDGINILVDLAGYTVGARPEILALRAAPVQVNFLGFPGSLGADFYDYIITDKTVTPPEDQAIYAETFAYLPTCYQINDDREQAAKQGPDRAACGLPKAAFVFCCFNNSYKIDSGIFDRWAAILSQVPESVLWLLQGSPEQVRNLRREATERGLDPARLVFAEPLEKSLHLARHRHADLFLDTRYYNAHTTGSDALRMGVPMLTVPGQTFASRVGASLLRAVGLEDLVAATLDDYVDMAVSLATERPRLEALRRRLAENLDRSSLLDNSGFARALEQLYVVMWTHFADGVVPRAIGASVDAP